MTLTVTRPTVELREIPLAQLVPATWNPRKYIDQAKLEELTASIREKGVLEPVIVRPHHASTSDEPLWEVVAGNRREMAATLAGLETLPCLIRHLSDAEALEIAVIENSQRADVHPIEEAEAIERLMLMDAAYTVEAVAAKLGVHVTTVNRKLRLLRLIESARDAYKANAITAAHAERLSKLSAEQQVTALEECFSALLSFDDDDDDQDLGDDPEDTYDSDDVAPYQSDITKRIARGDWEVLGTAVASVNQLDAWIARHTKADLGSVDTKQLVLEQLDDDTVTELSKKADTPGDVVGALVQLSVARDYSFNVDAATTMGVLHRSQWVEIPADQEPCDQAQKGVVVHGGKVRVLTFCRKSKKCQAHWPSAPKTERSAEVNDWREQQKKDDERREKRAEEWKGLLSLARPALLEQLKPLQFNAALVRASLRDHDIKSIERAYGLALTDRSAAAVLFLNSVPVWDRDAFGEQAKLAGFDLDAFERKVKADQKAVAREEKKAAKGVKKGAK